MKKILLSFLCFCFCLLVSAQKVGLVIQYNMAMQIPKKVYEMTDLSKRQLVINKLLNQHQTYTLFTNGNECAFSAMGIDNNVIKIEGNGSCYTNMKDNKEIKWIILGSGRKKEWVINYIKENCHVSGNGIRL